MKKRSRPASEQLPAAADLPELTPDQDAAVESLSRLYDGVDGYRVARKARSEQRSAGNFAATSSTAYGEVDLRSFGRLLLHPLVVPPASEKQIFFDVGSGTAKPVLVAATLLRARFERCEGVELVEALHEDAAATLGRLRSSSVLESAEIRLRCDDMFACSEEWLKADVLFIPTTCFDEDMRARPLFIAAHSNISFRTCYTRVDNFLIYFFCLASFWF